MQRNNPNIKIPVLSYHNVESPLPPNDPYNYAYTTTPQHFEENITTLLNNGFETISLTHLYESVTHNRPLPPRPVVVTFDDGLEGVYTLAYPIIKRLGIKAVSFMITEWAGATVDGARYFNWEAAREMQNSGLIEIGSHSQRHTAYNTMAPEEVKADILGSFATLDKNLGANPLRFFAYPFGQYSDETIELLAEVGVHIQATGLALTTLGSINLADLPRISVTNFTTGNQIIRNNGL